MAEKIKEIRSVSYAHEFYCDKCNKFLGESEECADGYVAPVEAAHEVRAKVFLFDAWYTSDGIFCNKCAEEERKRLIEGILALGFEKGN